MFQVIDSNAIKENKAEISSTDIDENKWWHHVRPSTIENFMIICLDLNIDDLNENIKYTINQLENIISFVKTFPNIDDCMDFVTSINHEKIFLIISNSLSQQIVHLIQDAPQIDSIYVIRDDTMEHEKCLKQFRKIKGIYHVLKHDIQKCEKNFLSINVVSTTSSTNLDESDQSFMYSQLLKETIFNIKYDEGAKKEFAQFSRIQNGTNNITLKKIDQFQQNYESNSAILWYTKEPFIYSVLNKALRTQNLEIIMKMGFFLQDLHRQIEQLHSINVPTKPMIVYRGQGISNHDFKKITKSKGCLLSFNNFLSTSTDEEVSLAFAVSSGMDLDLMGILFHIEIDPLISSAVFASVNNIVGHFGDSESEILFSMHTVFRIINLTQIEDRVWQISLKLTSDNDEHFDSTN